jgi:hypothetical protein
MKNTKTLGEKVEKINKFCKGNFSVTHFIREYQFTPYDDGIFSVDGKYYNTRAKTFEKLIDKVYDLMLLERDK